MDCWYLSRAFLQSSARFAATSFCTAWREASSLAWPLALASAGFLALSGVGAVSLLALGGALLTWTSVEVGLGRSLQSRPWFSQ